MDEKIIAKLIQCAINARQFSYAPYSNFLVGAAILTTDGEIYSGCNVESAAFSPSICAERVALSKAISDGARSFSAIAIVGGHRGSIDANGEYTAPCGGCRQALVEFCGGDFIIIMAKSLADYRVHTLGELLPFAFSLTDIGGKFHENV